MLGFIFTILGAITVYRLWGDHIEFAVIALIATLYQVFSLRAMIKEDEGLQREDKIQSWINMFSSLIIIWLLIKSF
jgi:arginine exporter protein ArgO